MQRFMVMEGCCRPIRRLACPGGAQQRMILQGRTHVGLNSADAGTEDEDAPAKINPEKQGHDPTEGSVDGI